MEKLKYFILIHIFLFLLGWSIQYVKALKLDWKYKKNKIQKENSIDSWIYND